jgi:hypothetical protein
MRTRYTFPIPPEAVRAFSYRNALFKSPAFIGDEACACGPLAAVRAYSGQWPDDEFHEATPAFIERFMALPWPSAPSLADPRWIKADNESHKIFTAPPQSRFVIGAAVFSVEALALAAALPRCLFMPPTDPRAHMWFNFNGGHGLIFNRHHRLDRTIRELFHQPTHYDGTPVSKSPRPSFSLPGWPPPEPAE